MRVYPSITLARSEHELSATMAAVVSDPHEKATLPSKRRGCAGPLWQVAALWLPVALIGVAAKLDKAMLLTQTRGQGPGVRSLIAILSGDLVFFGAEFVFWSTLLGSRRPRLRMTSALLLHLVAPVLMGLLAIEHAYFRASGAIGDWFLLKDALRGFTHLTRLYRAQLSPARVALLTVPWLYSYGVLVVQRRATRARPRRHESPFRVLAPVGAIVLIVAAATRLTPLSDNWRLLRRAALGQLLADALEDGWRAVRTSRMSPASASDQLVGPTSLAALPTAAAGNVVIVALESIGAGATSLYGGPYDTTPFLKELARRGALVDRAYTTVPHTSKALVSLLCGIMPKLEPSVEEADPGAIPARCLPALLRDHGYATAFFQPAEENYERRSDLATEAGFDSFAGKESIDGTGFDESSYFGWEDQALLGPIDRWLAAHGSRPFFLTALTLAAHHPYVVPRGYPTRARSDSPTLNDYLNTVAYTDAFVRSLFELFERRGLAANTLFVILGDHGEAFGQHGRRQHDAVPYDEALRIPMVLVGPGIGPGRKIGGLRQIVDVVPTIANVLGFEAAPPFGGKDLLRTLGHDRIWASCYLRDYCLASIEGWTKIVHHHGRQADQMFDLQSDPGENHDLMSDEQSARYGVVEKAVRRTLAAKEAMNALYDSRKSVRIPDFVSKAPLDLGLSPAWASFEHFVELVGFEIQPRTTRAGGAVTVTVMFHVLEKPSPGWELFLHLEGPRIVNADHVPVQGGYPVSRWEVGDYVVDRHTIPLRPATEPEDFAVRLGFWQRESNVRAQVTAAPPLTVAAQDKLDLGIVEVIPQPIDPNALVLPGAPGNTSVDIVFGRHLRLLAAHPDRTTVKGGLKVTTTYDFQALETLGDRFELRTDLAGPVSRAETHVPMNGVARLSTWGAGDLIRDPHAILTRTSDPPGHYRLMLTLFDKKLGRRVSPRGHGLPIDGDRVQVAEFEIVP